MPVEGSAAVADGGAIPKCDSHLAVQAVKAGGVVRRVLQLCFAEELPQGRPVDVLTGEGLD